MKLHTNTLTIDEISAALDTTGLRAKGIILDSISPRGSRKRAKGFEVHLAALNEYNGKSKRRRRNSGAYGAAGGEVWAATYDEHGEWMAQLFERDPELILDFYNGRDDFHGKTHGAFRSEITEGMPSKMATPLIAWAKKLAEHAVMELDDISRGDADDDERITGIRSELIVAVLKLTEHMDDDDVLACTIEAVEDASYE